MDSIYQKAPDDQDGYWFARSLVGHLTQAGFDAGDVEIHTPDTNDPPTSTFTIVDTPYGSFKLTVEQIEGGA